MQRFDDRIPLNSISYSIIKTENSPQFSDDSCTCGRDELAFGDSYNYRRYNSPKLFQRSFSVVESIKNYGTATEHELNAPYPKQIADRYEAEYDYCMRWACDYKYVAAKVIPFQSNFYSVVRLMFKGRNWVLDCANFEGQYDYCGWLPSAPASLNMKKSLMTDSSEFTPDRIRLEAGRTLHSSDTEYGLQSLKTDYSGNSGLTRDPIDSELYQIMGTTSDCEESLIENSLHSTIENLSPILINNMAVPSSSGASTGSSLKAVYQDLVELDQIFARQVDDDAESQDDSLYDYVNCLTTAHSFSNISLFKNYDSTSLHSYSQVVEATPKVPTMFSQLACFAGKKFNIAFWKNWSKPKK